MRPYPLALVLLCLLPWSLWAVDTISLVNPQEQVDENAGGVDYLVARYGSGVGAVSVDIQITPNNATLGTDYLAPQPATLSWAAGDCTPKVVHLPILPIATFAPERWLTLGLVNVTGAVLDPSSSAVLLNILNANPNPAGQVVLVGTAPWGAVTVRDDSGTLHLTATRVNGAQGADHVTLALLDQSTQAGVDYTVPGSLTLNWADGESGPKTLDIPILPRAQALGARTLDVAFSSSGGNADNIGNGWLVTITDHLPALAGTISAPTTVSVLETAGTASISVARTGGAMGAVSVQWAIADDTAMHGVNYGGATSGTLSWADGDATAKSVVIPVIDDGIPDAVLDAVITYSTPTGGVILPDQTTTTLNIQDDDHEGLLSLSPTVITVPETIGSTTLTVTRSGGAIGAISVQWTTSDATAMAGSDYAASSGTLNWANGDSSSRQILIPILNGTAVLPTRWFNVQLLAPTGGAGLDPNHSWTSVTITNVHGGAPDDIRLRNAALFVPRTAGSLSAVLIRTGSGIGSAGVQIILSPGTGQLDLQYGPPSTSVVTWAHGELGPKTLTIPIINDGLIGITETFTLQLGVAYGNATQGSPSNTAVTIGDPVPESSTSHQCGHGGAWALITGLGFIMLRRRRDL